MRDLIATLIAAVLLAPGLSAAETIAVAEPVYRDMNKDEAQALSGKFEQALQQGGATVVKTFGEGKGGAEFVASLSLSHKGKELQLAAQITRVKLDSWAMRETATADGHDSAAVDAAVNELATRIGGAARSAPPRTKAAPPAPKRVAAIKTRQKAADDAARAEPKAEPARQFTNQPADAEGQQQDDAPDSAEPTSD